MTVRVTIGSLTFTAPSLDNLSDEQQKAMIAAYAGGNPPIVSHDTPVDLAATILPATIVAVTDAPKGYSAGWANPGAGDVHDAAAAARINAQHTALRAAGVNVDTSRQVAVTGTRMMREGYANQARRKVEHDAQASIVDVAHAIETRISAEHRTDVEISAAEFARAITTSGGKILVNDRSLTEQSIRGLAARLESPMLGYVLGVRDRMIVNATSDTAFPAEANKLDRAMIADVLAHECKRNPSVKLKLRTRNGGVDDVYAIVSPQYVEADATSILPEIMAELPRDTRATFAYDPASTQWEIRASVWTPTPVEEQAIGEAFEGYVSLRSRDNGTSRFRGDGGVTLIACYNAGVYNAGGASVSRVHRGGVTRDVGAMIAAATKSIGTLCAAWGLARAAEIPLTAEERKQGDVFLAALWSDMLAEKPLAGVLRGRKADHVSSLVSTYHAERRDPSRLVKADLAQSWTRYVQGQPADVRRDAEAAIGSWLVGGAL